jgi:hypothetical protein
MRALLFLTGVFVFTASISNGQIDGGFVEPKLKSKPKILVPKEAKETNVGGRVVVKVIVDEDGNVNSVDEVSGPGAVCRSVQREDVVAIRTEAARAAKLAKFTPAMANNSPAFGKSTIEFDFPVRAITGGEKEAHYQAMPVRAVGESGQGLSSHGLLNSKAISLPKPQYPRSAIAVNASGEVRVQVLILEDGTMFSAEATSGHPLLQPGSVIAACGAKFTPTLLDGKPVKVSGFITYNYTR